MIGTERRGRVYHARLRWRSQNLPPCGFWTRTRRPQLHTDPLLQEDPWSRRPRAESSQSSTDSKKHCAEDLREQADRSAVQAPCNTMTPVAHGLQLSSEENAIVAAINGALAPRLDGIEGQMGMLAGQLTSLKSDVVQLSAQVQHHDQRMSEF